MLVLYTKGFQQRSSFRRSMFRPHLRGSETYAYTDTHRQTNRNKKYNPSSISWRCKNALLLSNEDDNSINKSYRFSPCVQTRQLPNMEFSLHALASSLIVTHTVWWRHIKRVRQWLSVGETRTMQPTKLCFGCCEYGNDVWCEDKIHCKVITLDEKRSFSLVSFAKPICCTGDKYKLEYQSEIHSVSQQIKNSLLINRLWK